MENGVLLRSNVSEKYQKYRTYEGNCKYNGKITENSKLRYQGISGFYAKCKFSGYYTSRPVVFMCLGQICYSWVGTWVPVSLSNSR